MTEPTDARVLPFVIVRELGFGVYVHSSGLYCFGDGDGYVPEVLIEVWPDAEFLTWPQLEERLK